MLELCRFVLHALLGKIAFKLFGQGKGSKGIRGRIVSLVNSQLSATKQEELSEAAVLEYIDAANYEGGSGRFWTCDPVDGTKGFIRGEQVCFQGDL